MLNMSQTNDIRDLKCCGMKISEIVNITGRNYRTVKKYLGKNDFTEQPPISSKRPSILDPYKERISEWLQEDRKHWVKQSHTAQKVYERLKEEEHYTGSYDTVQKYMKSVRSDVQLKATQELVWAPGYAQVDFGEADFYEDDECVRRKYLTASFPFSNDGYSQVFGGETAECVCQGLKDIFEYIGGVPVELVFDNATGVGKRIHDKIIETKLFAEFRAHYGFRVRFCSPRSGWEKGNVENKVGTIRRNLFVPIPHYHDVIEYNKSLLDEHQKKASELHYKKQVEISKLFEEDSKALLCLPAKPFIVRRYEWFKADGYGKICMEGRHYYSTCPENHGRKILAAIYAHHIDILKPNGDLLVSHKREYGEGRTDTSDNSTMLDVLYRNAGAWMNSGVRQDAPDVLRNYLDGLPKPELKERLHLLRDISREYGYPAALNAMGLAAERGDVNKSDATVIAARITGYGIQTPPSEGPALNIYDEAFLTNRISNGKKEATV